MLPWILLAVLSLRAAQPSSSSKALAEECNKGSAAACAQLAAAAERSCRQHSMDACADWAETLHEGKGTIVDVPRSLALFAVACEAREPSGRACAYTRVLADEDTGPEVRLRALGSLCDDGLAEACASLGRLHWRGQDVPRDEAKAAALFQRACDNGAPIGCYRLAVAYAEGRGLVGDAGRSQDLLTHGCEAGFDLACVQLAVLTHPQAPEDRDPQIADFLRSLDSPSWRDRAEAAEKSVKADSRDWPAIPLLMEAAEARDIYTRQYVPRALAAVGPPPGEPARAAVRRALLALLRVPDRDPRRHPDPAVFDALEAYGDSAVPDLIPLLHDRDTNIREHAARTLGRIAPPARPTIDALLDFAKETGKAGDRTSELIAAIALVRISPEDASPFLPLLVEAVKRGTAEEDVDLADAAIFVARSGRPDVGVPFFAGSLKPREEEDRRIGALSRLASLGPIAKPWVMTRLRAAVADTHVGVRDAAVAALTAIAPDEAPAIVSAIRERERALARRPAGGRLPAGELGIKVRRLSSKSPAERAAAARALFDPGVDPAAVPWLIAVLGDDADVPTDTLPTSPGEAAAGTLASAGALVVEALGEVLRTGTPSARQDAAAALGKIGGSRAVDLLRAAAVDRTQPEEARFAAVEALGAVDSRYARDALAAALDDRTLRANAARCLSKGHDRRAIPALLEDLDSPAPELRWNAASGLIALPDARNIDPLLRMTRSSCAPLAKPEGAINCEAAAEALAATGDPRAVPPLIDVLESLGREYTRFLHISITIGRIGDSGWHGLVEALSSDRPSRRLVAVYALSDIAERLEPHGLENLLAQLGKERDAEVRNAIVQSLRYFRDPARVDALLAALRDPTTRRSAVSGLETVKDWRVVPALADALERETGNVASEILRDLRTITGQDAGTDPAAWRSWWAAKRPEWEKEQAFRARTLRIAGRLLDAEGKPLAGRLIRTTLADDDRGLEMPLSGWGCGGDAYGNLTMYREPEFPANPGSFTDQKGEFVIADSRHLLRIDTDYSLFVMDGWKCSRLFRNGQASFHVDADSETIRVGDVTTRLTGPSRLP